MVDERKHRKRGAVEIGIVEAKTHLSSLLDRVDPGEKITITKYEVPVVNLVPAEAEPLKLSHAEVVEGMRALRQRVKCGKPGIREMIQAGRQLC